MSGSMEVPITNPDAVLREEFDEWAIVFEPNTGSTYGLTPTGVVVWKALDGSRTVDEICAQLRQECNEVPTEVAEHVHEFIRSLADKGLVGYVRDATTRPAQ